MIVYISLPRHYNSEKRIDIPLGSDTPSRRHRQGVRISQEHGGRNSLEERSEKDYNSERRKCSIYSLLPRTSFSRLSLSATALIGAGSFLDRKSFLGKHVLKYLQAESALRKLHRFIHGKHKIKEYTSRKCNTSTLFCMLKRNRERNPLSVKHSSRRMFLLVNCIIEACSGLFTFEKV